MFRDKPYTKCFDCIQGDRLKCKKCMTTLVNNIIQDKTNLDQPLRHQKTMRITKKLIRNPSER